MSKNGVAGGCLAIEAPGLVKVFGEARALDRIDLTVCRGQVVGFLGPNGGGQDHHPPHPWSPPRGLLADHAVADQAA